MVRKLQEEYKAAGCIINMDESKYLVVGEEHQKDQVFEDARIKQSGKQ